MTALDYCSITIHGLHSVFRINMSSGLADSFQSCSTLNEFQMRCLMLEWAKAYGSVEVEWMYVLHITNVTYWRLESRLLWVEYCILNIHDLLELLECNYYRLHGNSSPSKNIYVKYPWYLLMWIYWEIGSLRIKIVKKRSYWVMVGSDPWLVYPYKKIKQRCSEIHRDRTAMWK